MKLITGTLVAAALVASSVGIQARDVMVRFNGGIGVIPASNGAGPPSVNTTRYSERTSRRIAESGLARGGSMT